VPHYSQMQPGILNVVYVRQGPISPGGLQELDGDEVAEDVRVDMQ
jgi:hypothetical protein